VVRAQGLDHVATPADEKAPAGLGVTSPPGDVSYWRLQVPKHARFAEFLRRLEAAQPASTSQLALTLIASTLTEVEDELTDIPADPERWMTDGRMYPPQADSRREVADRPDVTRFRSRRHNTYVAANGAIEIRDLDDRVLFRKAGANGEHVWKT
jgi:hypothetical protein